MSAHIGDDAELYPLGLLDAAEQQIVEEHIGECAECAARVAAAEAASLSLAAALPMAELPTTAEPPPAPLAPRFASAESPNPARTARGAWLAGAAAALILVAVLSWQTSVLRDRVRADDVALATIVHGHFQHAPMIPAPGSNIAAKVLYATDGSWVYVVVDRPEGQLSVEARTASWTREIGTIRGNHTGSLLVHPETRIESLTLRSGETPVASVTLDY